MDKPEVRKALVSQTLKEWCKQHHLTQKELAEELSIDPPPTHIPQFRTEIL